VRAASDDSRFKRRRIGKVEGGASLNRYGNSQLESGLAAMRDSHHGITGGGCGGGLDNMERDSSKTIQGAVGNSDTRRSSLGPWRKLDHRPSTTRERSAGGGWCIYEEKVACWVYLSNSYLKAKCTIFQTLADRK